MYISSKLRSSLVLVAALACATAFAKPTPPTPPVPTAHADASATLNMQVVDLTPKDHQAAGVTWLGNPVDTAKTAAGVYGDTLQTTTDTATRPGVFGAPVHASTEWDTHGATSAETRIKGNVYSEAGARLTSSSDATSAGGSHEAWATLTNDPLKSTTNFILAPHSELVLSGSISLLAGVTDLDEYAKSYGIFKLYDTDKTFSTQLGHGGSEIGQIEVGTLGDDATGKTSASWEDCFRLVLVNNSSSSMYGQLYSLFGTDAITGTGETPPLSSVPEPTETTLAFAGLGILGLLARRRKLG